MRWNRDAFVRSSEPRPIECPGSSIKSMIGHPQGASGAAGIVASAMALAEGMLPPTINLQNQDPDCNLDYVANCRAQERAREFALVQLLGFGSKNSAIVSGRPLTDLLELIR
jgi:3-oxoacyl-[acyl-carrier-protein] synthase II